MPSRQDFLITNTLPRDRFPEQSPSTNELWGPHSAFVSGTNKGQRVSSVKNTHLKPSCHRVGTTTKRWHTKSNPTCVREVGQDYPMVPITLPSPGVNPTIYPSFPTLSWRVLPEDRIPKLESMKVFFSLTCRVRAVIPVCVCVCVETHIHFSPLSIRFRVATLAFDTPVSNVLLFIMNR
jgi:hypothetical protein